MTETEKQAIERLKQIAEITEEMERKNKRTLRRMEE